MPNKPPLKVCAAQNTPAPICSVRSCAVSTFSHLFFRSPRFLTSYPLVIEEEEFITNWEEIVESFDDMGLKEGVLRGIYGYGFVRPSPIQQKGIMPVIQGKDTIAQVNFILNNNTVDLINFLGLIWNWKNWLLHNFHLADR